MPRRYPWRPLLHLSFTGVLLLLGIGVPALMLSAELRSQLGHSLSFQRRPAEPLLTAKVGVAAPEFLLADLGGSPIRLSDFRGRPVVIEFGSFT